MMQRYIFARARAFFFFFSRFIPPENSRDVRISHARAAKKTRGFIDNIDCDTRVMLDMFYATRLFFPRERLGKFVHQRARVIC